MSDSDFRELMLERAKAGKLSLEFLNKHLMNDREIVYEVLKHKPLDIRFVSGELRNDKELALFAIEKDKKAFNFIILLFLLVIDI